MGDLLIPNIKLRRQTLAGNRNRKVLILLLCPDPTAHTKAGAPRAAARVTSGTASHSAPTRCLAGALLPLQLGSPGCQQHADGSGV